MSKESSGGTIGHEESADGEDRQTEPEERIEADEGRCSGYRIRSIERGILRLEDQLPSGSSRVGLCRRYGIHADDWIGDVSLLELVFQQ